MLTNLTVDNELLYHGRRYDSESNLYYYRARYYDPILGRFLSTDPMGYKDSMNLYQAFNMNGMNFVDPFGERIVFTSGLSLGEREDFLNDLEKLTGHKYKYTMENVVYISERNKDKNFKPIGKMLVEDLVQTKRNGYDLYIFPDEGTNRNLFSPSGGRRGRIGYIKKDDGIRIITDEKGKKYRYKTKSFITTGHELIHAWRHRKGIYNKNRMYVWEKLKDGEMQKDFDDISRDELPTVGLHGDRENDPTENKLRVENSFPIRVSYTDYIMYIKDKKGNFIRIFPKQLKVKK